MNSIWQKIIFWGASILMGSFLVCHFIFSYFLQIESDDFSFILWLNEKGFLGTMKYIYLNWEGAFGVLLISIPKILFVMKTGSLFLHQIITCILTLFFFFYFIRSVLHYFLDYTNAKVSWVLTVIIYTGLYYNGIAISDTWYWLSGSVYFFMPALLLFFIGVTLESKSKVLQVLALVYFFIFGASRFNYAVIFISALMICLAYLYLKEKQVNRKILLILSLTMISFVIYLAAPGNFVRRQEELTHILYMKDYLVGPLIMVKDYFVKFILEKSLFHILFLFPAIFVGSILKLQIEKYLPTQKKKNQFIFGLIAFVAGCIYMQCLSMFVARGYQTVRTLEFVSIVLYFSIATIFILVGTSIQRISVIRYGSCLVLILSAGLILRRVYVPYHGIKTYANASINMHKDIQYALGHFKGDTLVLKKLPPEGWLHCGRLTKRAGSDAMNNRFLENYYHTPFKLDVEE